MMNATDNFVLHELVHIIITTAIAVLIWYKYKDWRLVVFTFLIGIFIDVDHFIDYFMYYGAHFSLSEFIRVESYVIAAQKAYVLFHGWEFVPLVWLIGKWIGNKFNIKGLEWALFLSYLGHLCWDNISFAHSTWSYFFTYRLFHHFSLTSFNGG